MHYKHTQKGDLVLFMMLIVAGLFAFVLSQSGMQPVIITVMLFALLLMDSFASLTVSIDDQHLRIKFGYGIFRKKFALNQITSVKQVKNKWYYGWGIRFWFWPRMTIFNVSGFDAVEIKMNSGAIYRIGTDEPQMLEQMIQASIHAETTE